jgi:hypothetical protein
VNFPPKFCARSSGVVQKINRVVCQNQQITQDALDDTVISSFGG